MCPSLATVKPGQGQGQGQVKSWQTISPSLLGQGPVTRPNHNHRLQRPMQAMQVLEGTCAAFVCSWVREKTKEKGLQELVERIGYLIYRICFLSFYTTLLIGYSFWIFFFYRQRASRACEVRFFCIHLRKSRRPSQACVPRHLGCQSPAYCSRSMLSRSLSALLIIAPFSEEK